MLGYLYLLLFRKLQPLGMLFLPLPALGLGVWVGLGTNRSLMSPVLGCFTVFCWFFYLSLNVFTFVNSHFFKPSSVTTSECVTVVSCRALNDIATW